MLLLPLDQINKLSTARFFAAAPQHRPFPARSSISRPVLPPRPTTTSSPSTRLPSPSRRPRLLRRRAFLASPHSGRPTATTTRCFMPLTTERNESTKCLIRHCYRPRMYLSAQVQTLQRNLRFKATALCGAAASTTSCAASAPSSTSVRTLPCRAQTIARRALRRTNITTLAMSPAVSRASTPIPTCSVTWARTFTRRRPTATPTSMLSFVIRAAPLLPFTRSATLLLAE
jgi:hypothetical protein